MAEGDVFVAGGAAVYEAALPYADVQLLSEVDLEPEGDTFYPDVRPRRVGRGRRASRRDGLRRGALGAAGRLTPWLSCATGEMELRVFTEPQQGATYDDLLRVAQEAERLGFGAFFRSDHYLAMGVDGHPGRATRGRRSPAWPGRPAPSGSAR